MKKQLPVLQTPATKTVALKKQMPVGMLPFAKKAAKKPKK